jgi:hypothetical protein
VSLAAGHERDSRVEREAVHLRAGEVEVKDIVAPLAEAARLCPQLVPKRCQLIPQVLAGAITLGPERVRQPETLHVAPVAQDQ